MGGKPTTSTQSVSIPPEVLARYNAVNARAEDVAQTPFQPYTGEFVAGVNPTQQAGIQQTGNAATLAQPFYGAATGLTMAGAQDVGALNQNQIGYYQNPFTQAVVDPTIQALQQQQGQQLAQQQGQAIKAGAFGGDRAGLQRANLQSQQSLATAQAIAPLYQQGYQQAVQTAQGQQGVVAADLARRMQAGQQVAGIGTAAQQAALQGAQAQIGAGTLQQQTQQAGLTAQYQQFLQQQGYPFQVAQFLAGIAEGTGALSGSTTTTQTASDRRLKENIKEIGETNDGLPIYSYNYKGDDRTQIGLMAQDVEQVKPEAVGLAGGYKTVDYEKATEGSERHERYAGGGLMPSFSDYNSMGGAVSPEMQGEAFARGGYATDGGVGLGDVLQAQAALYGAQRGQQGAQKGYFPFDPAQMAAQQRQLMLPKFAPPTQQNAAYDAMKMAGATGEAFKGGKEIKQEMFGGKRYWDPETKQWDETKGWFSGWGDKSKTNTPPETPPTDKTETVVEESRGGRLHYATAGGLPYGGGLAGGMSYVPDDVLKQQEAAKSLQFKPGDPPKRPDQMADAVKAVSALNTAKSLYKAPGEIKSGLTKVQNFFSPDKAATGATEAGKDATTVATEAVKGAPTTPVNPDLPASGAKAIEATNPAGVNPAGTYTIPGTTETVTPGLGAGAPAPAATGVVPEAASVVPAATTEATGAGLGAAADTAALGEAGAGLAGGAEAAGAVAGGAEAAAAAGATMEELAPLLLMLLKRGGAAKPHYAKGYYSGGLVREHHDGPNDTNGQSNVVGDGDTGVIPPEMMAIARDPAEDQRMSERMRTTLPKFREAYPDLYEKVVGSAFRTEKENKEAGGAKGSQHLGGNALDLKLRGLDPDKQAEVLNWWRDQGAGGFGYYPNKESAHVDFGSPRAWGPNYSRTSLHQTPQFFQKFAEAHTGQPVPAGGTISDAISGGARKVSDAVTSAPGVAYDYASKFMPESDDAKLALLAGIFGTLASPSPHRLGAIGQGGLAAISTYGQLRKMGNEQVKQTVEMMKGRFGDPVKVGDQWMVPDNWQGKLIPQSQVGDLYRQALSGSSTATGVKQTTAKPDEAAATTERGAARADSRPAAAGLAPPVARTASADRPVPLDTTGVKPLSAYDTAEPSPIAFGKPALSRFSSPDMPEDERAPQAGAPGTSMGVMPAYATMFPQVEESAAMQDYKMPSDAVGLARQTLREQASPAPTAAAPAAAAPAQQQAQAEAAPAEQRDKLAIKADLIRKGPTAFANVPEDMNPVILRQKATGIQSEIERKTAEADSIEKERGSTPQAVVLRQQITQLAQQRKDFLDRSEKGLDEAAELIYGREKSLFEQQTAQRLGQQRAPEINVPLPEGMSQAQAEFDPDYLATRAEAYRNAAKELRNKGFIEDAEKYVTLANKDRDNLVTMGSTERETPQGTKYVLRPGAPVYQTTPPKTRPTDYTAAVDPNTGIVSRKEVGEFVGHPETGGFAPDPAAAGRKLDLGAGGDKVVGEARAASKEQEKEFVEGVSRAREAIPTVMKAATALKYIESKGLTMEKAEMANIAEGLGLSGVANKIMSQEERNAAYIILKSSVDQAVQQISQNFARPTQGEFKLTKEEATTDPKLPVEASYSIAKTQLARGLWQNALMSDWENYKRQTGANNFVGFKDMWQKTHPSALFEDSASRIMGNLKGEGLPPVSKVTEGALYVVPDRPSKGASESDSAFYNYLIKEKNLKPGDVFVAKNVNHESRNIDVEPVGDFKSAYNVALRAPALTYGVR